METFHRSTAGIDYPRNPQEFDRWFADEAACRTYIFRIRCPVGYECFRCRSKAPPQITSRGYLHCRQCSSEISITVGTVLSDSGDPAHVAMPGVHRIASLLKRWLLGIHQGAVSGKHLDFYLDEYTFRFNRRTSRSRGMLFYRLMQQAVATASVPYQQLVDAKHNDVGGGTCVKWIAP